MVAIHRSTFVPTGLRDPRSVTIDVSRHRLKDGPDWADVPAPNLASTRWTRPMIPRGFLPGDIDPSKGGTVMVNRKRVSIAPVFDPDAVSMVPIPGWTAAGSLAAAA